MGKGNVCEVCRASLSIALQNMWALCYKEGLSGQEGHLVVVSSTDHGLMEGGLINARLLVAAVAWEGVA